MSKRSVRRSVCGLGRFASAHAVCNGAGAEGKVVRRKRRIILTQPPLDTLEELLLFLLV